MATARALNLIPYLDDSFLPVHRDVPTTLDYVALVDCHRAQDGIVTIARNRRRVHGDLGIVESDCHNRLLGDIEQPILHGQADMGIYPLEPAALHMLQRELPLDAPDLMRKLLAANQEVLAYPDDGCQWDIGRPDDYAQANQDVGRLRDQLIPSSSACAGKTF